MCKGTTFFRNCKYLGKNNSFFDSLFLFSPILRLCLLLEEVDLAPLDASKNGGKFGDNW